jgi:hypothetical protein
MKKIINLDVLGIGASLLCLVHCMSLPWLISLAGVYFKPFVGSPHFHDMMLGVSILIGLPVFIRSFARHKSKRILMFGLLGLSLTTFGTMQEDECCPPVVEKATCQLETDACGACSSADLLEAESASSKNEISETVKQGFNVLPFGITLLILAHFMNFKKRSSCENSCCP